MIEPYGEMCYMSMLTRAFFDRENVDFCIGVEEVMRITSAVSFGKAIRARRKELNYTQGFLSEFSGLSVSFISDLENGKKTAELEKAIYLANLLGLDLCLKGREHGT